MISYPGFDTSAYLVLQERNPALRDKAYYLQNARAFYSSYLNGTSTIGWDGATRFEILRLFSEGRQPSPSKSQQVEKSGSILDINGNPIEYPAEERNSDILSINPNHDVWDILSPAPKIMEALLGTFAKIDYEISADPLDYNTIHEVEDAKWERWAIARNAEKIKMAAAIAGVEFPIPENLPETQEDMDQNSEEFMPAHLRYIEQIVKHSFDISHWSPDVKMMFYRDLLIGNKACIQNQYDPEDGKVKPTYISPTVGDVQRSDFVDCRDSERGWHFSLMSISTLRQYFPDKDEDFFRKAAKAYAGKFGNPRVDFFDKYNIQQGEGWGYDAYKVCIFNCEWIDIDTTKEVISKNKYGREMIKEVPLNKKVASDKVVRFSDTRMRFQCKWVIGTDDIFEYGPAYDVTYPSKNDTELTYKWIVLPGKSKMEQLVPILNNFQNLWEKYKELLRNSQGKIQFLDVDMMATVDSHKEGPNVAAKKAFRRFLATNKLLFRRVNAAGMPNQNRPIEEMDGGMGSMFTEIQNAMKMNIDLVEYITGLNPMSLGQSPDPNAPVTTTQMAMNATSNVLRPIVDGGMRMKQGVAENLVRWTTILIRGNKYSRDAYKEVIGKYGVQAIITATRDECEYGITLTPRPNDAEKQWLLQQLQQATTPVPGSGREISTADGNVIMQMIMSDTPVKTVSYYMEKARKRQEERSSKDKQAMMQQQSQLNQQDAQVSNQAKMQADQLAHQNKMAQIQETNKGLVTNTMAQETMRKDKDQSVQAMKNMQQMYVGENGKEYSHEDLKGVHIHNAVKSGKLKPKGNG